MSEWDIEAKDWINWKKLKPPEDLRQLHKNIPITLQGRAPVNKDKKDY